MRVVRNTHSPEETERFGEALGRHLRPGDVVALIGDLGTGKTCLTRGIARGSGIRDDSLVSSPTFVLVHEYPVYPRRATEENTDISDEPVSLYHLDLYRLRSGEDLEGIGGEEILGGNGIAVVEWAERAEDLLPPQTLRVELTTVDESIRRIEISGVGAYFDWLSSLEV